MMNERTYIKTDRNGTKYWQIKETCPHCGGRGDYICGINYGTCFECGGSGIHQYIFKEYTEEYEAKLEAKRAARAEKALKANEAKEQEWRINNMMREGFSADGIGYIHYGDTYKAKDTLKANGARWNNSLKAWIAPKRIEYTGVKVMEIKAEDICYVSGNVDSDKAYDLREKLN